LLGNKGFIVLVLSGAKILQTWEYACWCIKSVFFSALHIVHCTIFSIQKENNHLNLLMLLGLTLPTMLDILILVHCSTTCFTGTINYTYSFLINLPQVKWSLKNNVLVFWLFFGVRIFIYLCWQLMQKKESHPFVVLLWKINLLMLALAKCSGRVDTSWRSFWTSMVYRKFMDTSISLLGWMSSRVWMWLLQHIPLGGSLVYIARMRAHYIL